MARPQSAVLLHIDFFLGLNIPKDITEDSEEESTHYTDFLQKPNYWDTSFEGDPLTFANEFASANEDVPEGKDVSCALFGNEHCQEATDCSYCCFGIHVIRLESAFDSQEFNDEFEDELNN